MDKEKIEAGRKIKYWKESGKTRTEKGLSIPLTALPECMKRYLVD